MTTFDQLLRQILAEEEKSVGTLEGCEAAIMRAMGRAYDRGRYDQRILDDLTSPAGKSQAGGG